MIFQYLLFKSISGFYSFSSLWSLFIVRFNLFVSLLLLLLHLSFQHLIFRPLRECLTTCTCFCLSLSLYLTVFLSLHLSFLWNVFIDHWTIARNKMNNLNKDTKLRTIKSLSFFWQNSLFEFKNGTQKLQKQIIKYF